MKKLLSLLSLFVFIIGFTNYAVAAGPGDDARCDGLAGAAFGMCAAALAVGCDDLTTRKPGCDKIEENFVKVTGETPPWLLPTCYYDGMTYYVGERFPDVDRCNTCVCYIDGSVQCTKMYCLTCDYYGEIYIPGEEFPAMDGCNTCVCMDDGSVACTQVACLPSP